MFPVKLSVAISLPLLNSRDTNRLYLSFIIWHTEATVNSCLSFDMQDYLIYLQDF